MEDIFRDMILKIKIFLDNIGIFDDDFDMHMTKIKCVLHHLQENGFTINPLKCKWAMQETDWLEVLVYAEWIKALEQKD
jgi:hypothetical protein